MGRMGTPEDVAGLIAYLTGDGAGFVTGPGHHKDAAHAPLTHRRAGVPATGAPLGWRGGGGRGRSPVKKVAFLVAPRHRRW